MAEKAAAATPSEQGNYVPLLWQIPFSQPRRAPAGSVDAHWFQHQLRHAPPAAGVALACRSVARIARHHTLG